MASAHEGNAKTADQHSQASRPSTAEKENGVQQQQTAGEPKDAQNFNPFQVQEEAKEAAKEAFVAQQEAQEVIKRAYTKQLEAQDKARGAAEQLFAQQEGGKQAAALAARQAAATAVEEQKSAAQRQMDQAVITAQVLGSQIAQQTVVCNQNSASAGLNPRGNVPPPSSVPSFQHPGELETVDHLLFRCPVTARLWKLFSNHHMGAAWVPSDFLNVALEWDNLQGKYKSLPFYFVWEVWKGRNRLFFDGVPFQISQVFAYMHAWLDDCPVPCASVRDCSKRNRPHEISLRAIYFDGACVEGLMGCRAWVKISQRERVHVHWNAGWGTNNKAELIALWGALRMTVYLQLQGVHVYGDSQIVIGWIVGHIDMMRPDLQGWLHRVRDLWDRLERPPISHIYRETNTRADGLSRKGLESFWDDAHSTIQRQFIILANFYINSMMAYRF